MSASDWLMLFRSEAGAETGGNQHRRLGEASARDEFSGEAGARDRDTPSTREFSGQIQT